MNSTFEFLESRQLLSAGVSHLHKQPRGQLARTGYDIASPRASASPSAGSYTPSQLRAAYGFSDLSLPNVSGDGAGQTIAIIDAYDDPDFVSTGSANFNNSDLRKFDTAFGLQDPPAFIKVNQFGGTTLPAQNTGWDGEIALDVEWSHAIAPKAKIVLVEANSTNTSDLIQAAVNYAKSLRRLGGLDEFRADRVFRRDELRQLFSDTSESPGRNVRRFDRRQWFAWRITPRTGRGS